MSVAETESGARPQDGAMVASRSKMNISSSKDDAMTHLQAYGSEMAEDHARHLQMFQEVIKLLEAEQQKSLGLQERTAELEAKVAALEVKANGKARSIREVDQVCTELGSLYKRMKTAVENDFNKNQFVPQIRGAGVTSEQKRSELKVTEEEVLDQNDGKAGRGKEVSVGRSKEEPDGEESKRRRRSGHSVNSGCRKIGQRTVAIRFSGTSTSHATTMNALSRAIANIDVRADGIVRFFPKTVPVTVNMVGLAEILEQEAFNTYARNQALYFDCLAALAKIFQTARSAVRGQDRHLARKLVANFIQTRNPVPMVETFSTD